MHATTAQRIAEHYRPSRWHYHYSRAKLRSDPLYDHACAALAGVTAPILDVGCGIGLLAHCLATQAQPVPYLGIDSDADKIQWAIRSTQQLRHAEFAVMDLTRELPPHHGSVVMLDVLQYLPAEAQQRLLDHVCQCIAPTGRLVIRTGLGDDSWRSKLTYAADLFGRAIRWMNSAPQRYPTQAQLAAACQRHGLTMQLTPLWGSSPFNNWLLVAAR